MKSLILSVAITACALPALAHSTQTSEEATSVKVSYADLDLSRQSDANRLSERIQAAAMEACGASSFSAPGYREAVKRSDCYKLGVAHALEAVDKIRLATPYKN